MKSVSWARNVPNMKGKKSLLFSDDEIKNHREKLNEIFDWKLARDEIPELVSGTAWDSNWDSVYDVWYDWETHYDT
jgi:hypothetical protein